MGKMLEVGRWSDGVSGAGWVKVSRDSILANYSVGTAAASGSCSY